MKSMLRRSFPVLIIFASLALFTLLLSACSNPVSGGKGGVVSSGGSGQNLGPTGTITITLGAERAAAWPPGDHGLLNALTHNITVVGQTSGETHTRSLSPGQTTVEIPVSPGAWNVKVEALYKETGYSDILYASGSNSVSVSDGQSTPCNINMTAETVFFNVSDEPEWVDAVAKINSDVINKKFLIRINSGFTSMGTNSGTITFNTGLDVNIRGYGNIITITGTANSFLRIPSSVTVLMENLNLAGHGSTNAATLVYVFNGNITMKGGSISNNINTDPSTGGGGVFVNGPNAVFTATDVNISDNSADADGGGVFVAAGKFEMNGGSIYQNDAGIDGGGVYVTSGGKFIMNGGTIGPLNSAPNPTSTPGWGSGGGVFVGVNSEFTASGVTITNNSAAANGGGVFVNGTNAVFTMNGGTIGPTNSATSVGGGVYVGSGGEFIMNGSATVTGNSANNGGGVYLDPGSFTMNNGTISGNTAANNGGGVYVMATFTMDNGTISANEAISLGGGVFVDGVGVFTMNGGTVYGRNASPTLRNLDYGVPPLSGAAVFVNSGTALYGGSPIVSPGFFGTDNDVP